MSFHIELFILHSTLLFLQNIIFELEVVIHQLQVLRAILQSHNLFKESLVMFHFIFYFHFHISYNWLFLNNHSIQHSFDGILPFLEVGMDYFSK